MMKRMYLIAAVCAAVCAALCAAPTANEDFVVAEVAAAYSNAVYTAGTNTTAAIAAADASLSSRLSLVSLAATNYTDAVAGQVRAAIPTNNAQLVNGAGYVTAAITNGLQLTETDPTVPEWAKAESAPLPPNYVAVSNAAKSAATPQQLAAKQDKLPYPTNAIPQGAVSGLSAALNGKLDKTGGEISGDLSINGRLYAYDSNGTFDFSYGSLYMNIGEPEDGGILYLSRSNGELHLYHSGETSDPHGDLIFPYGEGTLALMSDIPDVSAIGDDATNYTDSVAGELSTSINQKYSKSSGDQLAQQVSAIGAHLNGEDARFVVTNYDSVVHTPEAYVEIKVSNNWLRVWDEGTRWNQYEVWKTNVDAELSMKADRAWGVYDSETGGYSPAGFTQVSSSNILIASGMAYQRTVTSAGAVWVLQCNTGVAQLGGDTNGYFKVKDSDGVTQFEIVKGDKRELGCDASGISLDYSTTPNNVIIPYSVVAENHPSLYITERLETQNWKKEDDSDCIATVTWTGTSGAYVATVHPKQAYASMFVRATYMVGGETYIKNNAPVSMDSIMLNGQKYYLGTATIDGHTVLTLSTTAP